MLPRKSTNDGLGGCAKLPSYGRRHSLMYAFLYTMLVASLIAWQFISPFANFLCDLLH